MKGQMSNTGQGRISELKAEVILLERGWDVWRPSVDNGVDLIAWPHCFQVKSAVRNANDGYSFWLGGRGIEDEVDFYALHMRTEDVWLVVPLSVFAGKIPRSGITITPRGLKNGRETKWASLLRYRDAWPTPR
jgi:hypothetical protein